jgi:hypothetical protein
MNHAVRSDAGLLSLAAASPGVVIGAGVAAMVFGLTLPASPWDAVAVLVLLPLGLAMPTAAVVAILAITVLVPWDVQNHFQILGGHGHRGVLFVDALLLISLLRTGWSVVRRRTAFDLPMVLGTTVAAILAAATFWGVAQGADVSAAGNEGRRALFGACTFLLAWPLLREPDSRRVITRWLVIIGLALGIWGFSQWFFDVGYSTAGDVGVRGGLSSGQLQGGMYAYPVAVALAWSALIADITRSSAHRALLLAVLALNTICVFLTFERTLIASTALACGFVVANAGAGARRNAMRWIPAIGVFLFVGTVLAAAQARTALERMSLLNDVQSDNSYTHRMIEADVVAKQILARPFFGSGFGATVTWGDREFAVNTTPFADLGYHWLAWKIGLPAAILIATILLWAVFRRTGGHESDLWKAVQTGSRGGLLALLVTSVLFGVFNALGITAVIGLLVAISYSGPARDQTHTARGWRVGDDYARTGA